MRRDPDEAEVEAIGRNAAQQKRQQECGELVLASVLAVLPCTQSFIA